MNKSSTTKPPIKEFFCLLLFSSLTFLFSKITLANDIQGKITFTGKTPSNVKVEETIVYFEPDQKVKVSPLVKPHKITMKNKAYWPRVSVVPVGSNIQISNSDSILHNAFSPSVPNEFDSGFYGKSDGKIHQFKHPGVVRIFCNVHFRMVAYTLVLDTPFYTKPNKLGNFILKDIPSGPGRLIVWHERTKRVIKKITLPIDEKQNIKLRVSKRRVPEHKNKSGSSYKKKRRKRGRYN